MWCDFKLSTEAWVASEVPNDANRVPVKMEMEPQKVALEEEDSLIF